MESDNLGNFILAYEKFERAENKSERHIEAVKTAVSQFDNYLGGCSDIKEVKSEDLREYICYLQNKPKWFGHPTIKQDHGILTDNAIASYVRSIRAFWSWLKREGFITSNPMEQVKPPATTEREVGPLTPEDVTRLLKVIPRNDFKGYRDICIIATMYDTGVRVSEILNLPEGNVSFDSGQIRVIGKGKKERTLFMSAKIYKALFKYYREYRSHIPSKYFFVQENGQPLTRFYFEHRMKAYVQKAEITTVCTPHILRYSYAIQFLRNGGDPFTLQKILGHSTVEMTLHYVKIANSDVEKKMKEFSPAELLQIRF